MSDSINHSFFSGLGNSGAHTTALPAQTLLEKQKNKAWKKLNLDRLELIAQKQFIKNIELNDFYQMVQGNLVYADYQLSSTTNDILELRAQADMPTHAKHYDFLGNIVNQIKGEYPNYRDKYRVDTTDEISQNEFTRTQTEKVREYTQKLFDLELKERLLAKGVIIDENKKFNSQEEQQQYQQELQKQKDNLIPPEDIQKEMLKNFKTTAAEWAERVLEFDWLRDDFNMEADSLQEIEDYILTGRWFRHYHIGYDYYKPERWHPCQTFFSEDVDARFPQDGEYVGRITWLSPSDIVNRFGSKITEDVQKRLLGFYNKSNVGGSMNTNGSLTGLANGQFGQTQIVPFEGYHDYDLTLQLQDVFNTPFGETTVNKDGIEVKTPAWFSKINHGHGFLNNSYASKLRTDIGIRTDLLQVTEAYWRSWKRVGILNYTTPDGFQDQAFVTDDLLPEFLEENNIESLKNVTLEESEKNPQPNTIVYDWIPEIRWGVKIKSTNSYLTEDLYIGGDAAPIQMKGSSNVYDVPLPVVGYIGNSTAKKIRPYIIKHNIVLNQIYSLLEKELGTFFLFDVHYLPSEYKGNTNVRETLEQMYDLIQDLGIVPIDTSKQNMKGNQPAMNAFMTQSLDFTNQIVSRMNLANQFKLLALEQIGITPQRTGAPNEYSTAEGIKQGMTASYAQTESIFSVMAVSTKKANLLHLTVAQYCQKNYKDFSFIYTKPDGEKAFIELSDLNFPLRNFGLVSINSSKDRKELESLRQMLLQNNTAGGDILALSEIASSDSMSTLIEVGRRMRQEQGQKEQAQRDHENEMLDKQLASAEKAETLKFDREKEIESMKIQGKIEESYINSLGRATDKQSDIEGFNRIDAAAQQALDNDYANKELGIKHNDQLRKVEEGQINNKIKLEQLALKRNDQRLKEKAIDVQREGNIINKN
jgi:hypothetical protein